VTREWWGPPSARVDAFVDLDRPRELVFQPPLKPKGLFGSDGYALFNYSASGCLSHLIITSEVSMSDRPARSCHTPVAAPWASLETPGDVSGGVGSGQ
jgi:hypothetical protein